MVTIINSVIPIFRIFDVPKAKEFYIDYLNFQIDWEHRSEENSPLYMQVSLGDLKLHLSEHYGDSTPGGAIRVEVSGIQHYHQYLSGRNYPYQKPGLETAPWGSLECRVIDPFSNRITFYENTIHED